MMRPAVPAAMAPGSTDALVDSPELAEFIEKNPINGDVARTLSLARHHFSVVEKPWFEIIDDADADEYYLAIRVNVSDGPDEIVG
jgi:hypothetical protein